MLGLELRDEFRGQRLKGTAIDLANATVHTSARDFLEITYPTTDVLLALESMEPERGRPVVLMGERGQGKSHLLAVMYHALREQVATKRWLSEWANRLNNPKAAELRLRTGMHVIEESLQRQSHLFLWDLLFEQHPQGQYAKGAWESCGDKKTPVPPEEILLEMFVKQPTAIILDEFQTWFDGLLDTDKAKPRSWAFNFIQTLSEIAQKRPEILLLVVSVRNGNTEAYQQIRRVNPLDIDFRGPNAKKDRQRLLLHRLFKNRGQIADQEIAKFCKAHMDEHLRLKRIAPSEHERERHAFVAAWPFSPHLVSLLEDQILLAIRAQETRDLIKILADLFKRRKKDTRILTPADFRVDDPESSSALIDSVANSHHEKLKEKALRNIQAVRDAVPNSERVLPELPAVISSLWLHSLAEQNQAGADAAILQIDVTQERKLDDNAFQAELSQIIENSFNIHENTGRYIFKEDENPQARLIATARNDRQFVKGEDTKCLANEVRYVLTGQDDGVVARYKIVVLPERWDDSPWEKIFNEDDHPKRWENRIPLLVIPEPLKQIHAQLGRWLCRNLGEKRNIVRFLLPAEGTKNIFADDEIKTLARCVHLADQWRRQNADYTHLYKKYQKDLRDRLKSRFNRFAILSNWNYQQPDQCRFSVEMHKAEGARIPDAIDTRIKNDLFEPEAFARYVIESANLRETMAKVLKDLQEPRPNSEDCIAWLGETNMREKTEQLCAEGKFAIDYGGSSLAQAEPGEAKDAALQRLRRMVRTGQGLDAIRLCPLQTVSGSVQVQTTKDADVIAEPVTVPGPPGPTPYSGSIFPASPPQPPHPPGTLFCGVPGAKRHMTLPATSALNLVMGLEQERVADDVKLSNVSLQVDVMTCAQLKKILMALPDLGLRFALDMSKEE